MARTKGSANFSGTIEPLAGGALDARSIVPAKADLTASGTFPYPYIGMETYVVAEDKKYRLIGADPTNLTNWEEVGGGSTIEVDDEISSTSENPVQNKVIKTALDGKQDGNDKMTESDMDDVVNPIPGAGSGGGGVSDFNDLENRPTKEVTSMSNITTPLPGTMSRRMKYSTEEQVIGEWIDGKPLYQKTVKLNFSTSGETVFPLTIISSEIDYTSVKYVFGYAITDYGVSNIHIPCYFEPSAYVSIYMNVTGNIYLDFGTQYRDAGNYAYITFRYTKTTD